ncbi:hypothetical protein ME763_17485 [Streptomyces murinus]|uniref:hypothetical protein n=1 Tax=Streptomyces murinus TaxID=33900 RepID=UPI000A21F702|nr:hypothetical protein [Streptomyces murinus]WDO07311.1 hypothetical protein ME763_17485 [Streptomyces murinus]
MLLALGLCGTGLLPAAAASAATGPGAYAFAPGARTVEGTASTAGAPRLDPGRVYRGSLPAHGRLTYRLDLADATATAYVPVTAVPPAHTDVTSTDGIRVTVRDAHGTACSFATARFGAGLSPRPVTALGRREAGRALCRAAGTYSVLVERLDTGGTSAPWDLELAPVMEPRLTSPGPTGAPRAWDSASPEPITGEARERAGGAGFTAARALGPGVWRTTLVPGRTVFYKVPLDWGRRLQASAELGGAAGHGYVGGALDLSLYDPVRGLADDVSLGYTGVRKPVALAPLPPVEYANRYAAPAAVSALRFAGDYYLVLHLSDRLTETFGPGPYEVTLRVRVDGRAHAGPGYAGRPQPDGVFTPTAQAEAAPPIGDGGGGLAGGGSPAMKAVAAGGIGLGTALLLVLGGWTLAARRAQTRVSAQKPTA